MSKTKAKKLLMKLAKLPDDKLHTLTREEILQVRRLISYMNNEFGPQSFAALMHLDLKLFQLLSVKK